jgi:hypothetical protein
VYATATYAYTVIQVVKARLVVSQGDVNSGCCAKCTPESDRKDRNPHMNCIWDKDQNRGDKIADCDGQEVGEKD